MDYRLVIFLTLCLAVFASAFSLESDSRSKRDVMESMKNAWNEVIKTFADAGDAVVHVFKPTEKSIIDKVADSVKGLSD